MEIKNTLSFQQIFDHDGLYVGDDFHKGVAFKIEGGIMKMVTYKDKDDIFPEEENALMFKSLLTKKYRQVFNRNSLF